MKIGLQLWTVNELFEKDPDNTFAVVHDAGYEGVEAYSGIDGMLSAEKLTELLEKNKLKLLGSTVGIDDIIGGDRDKIFSYYRAVKCPVLVCPGVFDLPDTAQGWLDIAAKLNEFGRKCAENGIRFMYHIHGHEFGEVEGKSAAELLFGSFDPAYVGIQPDVYWVKWGGADPVSFIRHWMDLFDSVHLKDTVDASSPEKFHDTEIGDGVIDTEGILLLCKERNMEWVVVEQEAFDMDIRDSIRISAENINKLQKKLDII